MCFEAHTWIHCCKVCRRDQKALLVPRLPKHQKQTKTGSVNVMMRSENTENLLLVISNLRMPSFPFACEPTPTQHAIYQRHYGFYPLSQQEAMRDPAVPRHITTHSFCFWRWSEGLWYHPAKGDVNSGRACAGPSSDLRHPPVPAVTHMCARFCQQDVPTCALP